MRGLKIALMLLWGCAAFVVALEVDQPFGDGSQTGEVVGCQHLALLDGAEALDLVEPSHRRVF